MRAFYLCALALSSLCGQASAAGQLLDRPLNTQWREQLQVQSARVAARNEAAARAAGQLGCRQHCEILNETFAALRTVTEQQFPSSAGSQWRLVITQRPDEQAWALPDGRVFVSEEFVRREALSHEELAFVLAHEIAHFALAHEADTVDHARRLTPFGIGDSVRDVYAAMDFDLGLVLRMAPMFEDMELEADYIGLMLAAMAGYDPDRAIGLLRKFAAQGEQRAIVSTHPQNARRLKAAEALLPAARMLYEQRRQPAP